MQQATTCLSVFLVRFLFAFFANSKKTSCWMGLPMGVWCGLSSDAPQLLSFSHSYPLHPCIQKQTNKQTNNTKTENQNPKKKNQGLSFCKKKQKKNKQ
jgi:hypothetical protein